MNENKNKVINYAQDFGALIALILLVAGISIASPSFRTGANFLSLLRQSSINGLIAFGMTFVILTDAIDLSVGSGIPVSRHRRQWQTPWQRRAPRQCPHRQTDAPLLRDALA